MWTTLTIYNPHTGHTFTEELRTDDVTQRVTWLIGRGMRIEGRRTHN